MNGRRLLAALIVVCGLGPLSAQEPTTVNPVSGSNWEGHGVIPDVEVPAADALDAALERARRQ